MIILRVPDGAREPFRDNTRNGEHTAADPSNFAFDFNKILYSLYGSVRKYYQTRIRTRGVWAGGVLDFPATARPPAL